jgi:hypothetical protein
MTPRWAHILAAVTALVALKQDWLIGEMFWDSDTIWNILLALAINAALLVAVYWGLSRAFGERAGLIWLRLFSFAVFLKVVLSAAPHGRLLAVVALLVAVVLVVKLGEAPARKAMQAVAIASLVFILTPWVLPKLGQTPRVWLPATAPASTGKTGVMVILLDELGYAAAAPLADDLKATGLNVRYTPLTSAGANTQNVIPALFTGQDFAQARPCGPSAQCSGLTRLDYAQLRAGRDDIDVAGLFLPYCAIKGLRSCYRVQMPHEFGNAYVGLLSGYFRSIGLPLPKALEPPFDPNLNRRLLDEEMAFVRSAPFWTRGGVLYVHLLLPHPPGVQARTTLDADYAANIEESRRLVAEMSQRLRSSFGERFSLIVFSDHGLRPYWQTTGDYPGDRSAIRAGFEDQRVPLIVATPGISAAGPVTSNDQIFSVVQAEADRLR